MRHPWTLGMLDTVVELTIYSAMGIKYVCSRGPGQSEIKNRGRGRVGKQWLQMYCARLGTCLHQVYVRMTDREHNGMMA